MTESTDIYCSDTLFRSLIEASYCSFILLSMRRIDHPIDVREISDHLSLKLGACEDLFNLLITFGFIIPVKSGDKFIITQSGIDLISPRPLKSPWKFDPELPYNGDRLPTYVAFDLLPLRIYGLRRGKLSSGKNPSN